MDNISKKTISELEEDLFKGPDKEIVLDIDTAIRSRNRIIQIVTSEEGRAIYNLRKLAMARKRKIVFWTCTSGPFVYNDDNEREPYKMTYQDKPWGAEGRIATNPMTFLDFIEIDDNIPDLKKVVREKDGKKQSAGYGGGANYVLLDLPNFMPSSQGSQMSGNEIEIVRKLKDLREVLCERDDRKTIIIVSRDLFIPEDLKKIVPVLDWPLPNKEAIIQHLTPLAKEVEDAYARIGVHKSFDIDELGILADSLLGLTLDEVTNTFRQSAVRNPDRISIEAFVKYNIKAKKDIIRKSNSGLEFYEPKVNIEDNVGGLGALKDWLKKRKGAYSKEAQAYGLEYPKGLLLVGIPGNGKSLVAKAIASDWNMMLVKLDAGALFGSRVGQSESNMRAAIKTAEATAPCVVWIDEIEKAFAGINSSDRSDGGTAARVIGTFLQWLSEKESPVFIMATANRIDQLPAELVRKGRFDEIFYLDMPNDEEREEIIKIHLRKRNFNIEDFNIEEIVDKTDQFTGVEIENAIKDGMINAFYNGGRQMVTEDIIEVADSCVPLSSTMEEQLNASREWAQNNAKKASYPSSKTEKLYKKAQDKKLKRGDNSDIEILPPSDIVQGPDLGDGPQGE